MPVKLTQGEVAEYISEQGCRLLNTFVNSTTPLKIQCQCGNLLERNFNKIKMRNCFCKECNSTTRKPKRYKVTYADVVAYAKEHGAGVVTPENEYTGVKQTITFQCSCGAHYRTPYSEFEQSKSKKCKKCSTAEADFATITVKELEAKLIEKQVVPVDLSGFSGQYSEVRVRCTYQGCRNEFTTTWKYARKCEFLSCKECSDKRRGEEKKYTYEEVKDIVNETGCTLISKQYTGQDIKLDITCRYCSQPFQQRFRTFLKQKTYQCQKCSWKELGEYLRLSHEDVASEIEKGGNKLISGVYTGATEYNLKIQCGKNGCNNTFSTCFTNYKRGKNRCYSCGIQDSRKIRRKPRTDILGMLASKKCILLSDITQYTTNHVYNLKVQFSCGHIKKTNYKYIRNTKTGKCPDCSIIDSEGQNEVIEFIKSLGISNIVKNTREIIPPKELDIYLPDYKIAFEFNGLYFHSEIAGGYKKKTYHLDKWKRCRDKGIVLYTITDQEWLHQKNKIEAGLKSVLKKTTHVIDAAECYVLEVDHSTATKFHDQTSINYNEMHGTHIGIWHNNELIACLSFSDTIVLNYSIKEDYIVTNGPQAAFAYYAELTGITTMTSSLRIEEPNLNILPSLGFTEVKHTRPNLSYYHKKYHTLHSPAELQQDKLPTLLPIFDPDISYLENLRVNKYDRYFDCGNKIYVWKK
jgi:hypothetical protein